ncbi:ANTAR domain-containing protein [Trujillonella humicola]|uniref:ANTAR domain-containing protein n=1 Tax=Trujillonella humicola TaxID=3383699 RepID=UPI003906A9B6
MAVARDVARYAARLVDDAGAQATAVDLVGHLRVALRSRAVIEQAKGVLMERHGGSADDAFHRLVGQSQRRNRKLREIAAEVVASAGTPGGVTAARGPDGG